MHRIGAALLAASSCVTVAQAQPMVERSTMDRVLTLEQAVAAAQDHAAAGEAAQAEIAAARAARTVAGLRPNPSVQTQVENFAGSSPYGGLGQAETTVAVAMPVELGASARPASRLPTRKAGGPCWGRRWCARMSACR